MRYIGVYVALCLISGFAGALSMKLLDSRNRAVLQVNRLEVVDAGKNVRAVLSTEEDGTVSLRLVSKENKPLVTLAARDKDGGTLTFSSARIPDQVTVGYSKYGDFEDGHDRGAWGLQIAGPEHSKIGLNVFSVDGVLQGIKIPLEVPGSVRH